MAKKLNTKNKEQRHLHTQQIIMSIIGVMIILAMVLGLFVK